MLFVDGDDGQWYIKIQFQKKYNNTIRRYERFVKTKTNKIVMKEKEKQIKLSLIHI